MTARLLLALLPLLLAACGSCQRVAAHKEAFRAAAPAQADGPHLSVDIPEKMLDGWVDGVLRALPTADYRLPGLGDLGRYLGNYTVAARSLSVSADTTKGMKVDLDFDIKDGRKSLLGLELAAVAPITYDARTGRAVFSLRADMFEKVKPKLPANAVDSLTNTLYGYVPSIARNLLSKSTVRSLVNRSIDEIVDRAYALLRSQVLRPMGELGRFQIDLPTSVPISGLALRKGRGGDLRLDVKSSLAAAPLAAASPKQRPSADALRMRVSTDLVVALGNRLMADGKIPQRYDRNGKAQKDGMFEAGMDWQAGARPLKVDMWALGSGGKGLALSGESGVCLRARAGATPTLDYTKGKIAVGFEDGQIEEVDGPPLLEVGLGVLGITERAFAYSKEFAAGTTLRLGSDKLGVTVEGLRIAGDELVVDLSTGKPRS